MPTMELHVSFFTSSPFTRRLILESTCRKLRYPDFLNCFFVLEVQSVQIAATPGGWLRIFSTRKQHLSFDIKNTIVESGPTMV